MALRRKERPLSPEELKEKLTLQNAQNWMHSEPLCALSPDSAAGLLPLNATAEKELLVICLLDAGDYLSDRMIEILAVWKARYAHLAWRGVVAFEQKYLFLKNSRFFEHYKHIPNFSVLPIFLDPEGQWFNHFNASKEPKIIFLNQGNLLFEETLRDNFPHKIETIERKIQETFRLEDPGLPLPEVGETQIKGFLDQKFILADQISQTGHWISSPGFIATDDSQAAVSFEFEGSGVRLIATTHPKARENTKVQITLNDQPISAGVFGDQVHVNDKGQAVMEINRHTGVYEIIESDQVLKGTLKIKFMNAMENPVIFHEFRITNTGQG